ncbi:hypothetical protein WJX81_002584 [Elliptochloris bilobata]|uniref:Protein kinase domain-containing protein n=1 Tax=Elliptochloris bilobata TaxID=381761 RepID=A0AAW1S9C9_9CHLO
MHAAGRSGLCAPIFVSDSASLSGALKNDEVTSVAVGSTDPQAPPLNLVLQPQDWIEQDGGPVKIDSGRNVSVSAANPQAQSTIDFNGLLGVIEIQRNASLSFRSLVLRNYASQRIGQDLARLRRRNITYEVQGIGAWPSIIAEPFSEYGVFNVTSYPVYDNCTSYTSAVTARYPRTIVTSVNNVTVLVRGGPDTLRLPVTNPGSEHQVGEMQLNFADSVGICVEDSTMPASDGGDAAAAARFAARNGGSGNGIGGGPDWRVIVGAAVGAAAFVALLALAAVLLWRRRRALLAKEEDAAKREQRLQDGSPWQGGAPLDHPVGLGSLALASMSTSPRDRLTASGSGRGSGGRPSGGRGSIRTAGGGAARSPTAGADSGSAGTPAQGSAGDTGQGQLFPELWRLRWLGPLEDEQVEVGPLLGRGGYGRVFKGRWKGAVVAVKVVEHSTFGADADIAAAEERRVARESLLSTSLSHPNVVSTYKICTIRVGESNSSSKDSAEPTQGHRPPRTGEVAESEEGEEQPTAVTALLETWLLMEFCDRGSLSDMVRANRFRRKPDGEPDMSAILRCLIDVASGAPSLTDAGAEKHCHGAGMDYLHSAGVVHGDLKSANVLLRSTATDARGFTCKLGDFGLSRLVDTGVHTHISTKTYGTVTYMPPEMLSKSRLTRAVDVYSFGILMWHLFTCQEPWPGMSVGAVFYAVVYEDARPPVPADMPPAYRALMEECWSADAAARPSFPGVQTRLSALCRELRAAAMSKAQSS